MPPFLKTPARVAAYDGPQRSIDEVGALLPAQSVKISKVDGIDVAAGHVCIANDVTVPDRRWNVKVADVTRLERVNLAARRAAAARN